MKPLIKHLKKTWFLTLIGLIAISLLIFFLGPLLGFGQHTPLAALWSRLLLIGMLFLVWGLIVLFRHHRNRKANAKLVEEMAAEPEADELADASREELAELRTRFDKALGVLKRGKVGHGPGRQYLYQLPWYVIIGPPGSGKTTALANSGLRFPLDEESGQVSGVRGVGGTRNCDWWFTDEAVLIDTAGRYTTQDSHQEADRAAWSGFLALLKRYRHKRPINGALVAISVSDLMTQTAAERDAQVRAIRLRIDELHDKLGVRFPVYLLITKCDLMAGFVEYFEDLGTEERKQVWGMTFPDETLDQPSEAVARYGTEFDLLEQRLNARVASRLHSEKGIERRGLIYGLPRQFSSLRESLQPLVDGIFGTTRFETRAILRGVYFTSGTQEGSPIDRLMGSLGRTFGLERHALASFTGKGRSYFITRLLQDVIFPEASLAGSSPKAARRHAWMRAGALGSIALLTVLGIAALVTSYTRNLAYMAEVDSEATQIRNAIDAMPPGPWEIPSTLPLLDQARAIPGGYDDREAGTPLLMGFGLYQGDKLGKQAEGAYLRLVESLVLPQLVMRLEAQMDEGADNPAYLYEALKTYLMLAKPARIDLPAVRTWIGLDWERQLPERFDALQRARFLAHIQASLAHLPVPFPIAQDANLVGSSRRILMPVSQAERAFSRLGQLPYQDRIADFRVTVAAGEDAARVFTRVSGASLASGIPGLYTRDGYRELLLGEGPALVTEVLGEGWVLGIEGSDAEDPEAQRLLFGEVRQRYLTEYVTQWIALLDDIDIVPFGNFRQGSEVAGMLAGKDSPLRLLLEAVATETTLAPPDGAGGDEAASDRSERKRLARLLDSSSPSTTIQRGPVNPVDRQFAGLHELMRVEEGSGAAVEAVLAILDELSLYLSSVDLSREPVSETPEIVRRVTIEATRQPLPLNRWLESLARNCISLARSGQHQRINTAWQSKGLPFCERAIGGRYPFARNSEREVALADFSRFFGPDGVMDELRSEFSEAEETAMPPTLQLSARIRDAFFAPGATEPVARFTLTPVSMSTEIQRIVLDIDGQQVAYDHGPVRSTALQWPGPDSQSQARMMMLPPTTTSPSAISERGSWAWFRLLDQTTMQADAPERYRVTFHSGERQAQFMLTADSVLNPFNLKALSTFRCPKQL